MQGPVPRWNRLVAQGPGIELLSLHAHSNTRVRRKRQDDTRAGPPALMASASTVSPSRPSLFELYSTLRSGLRCSLASPPSPSPSWKEAPPRLCPGILKLDSRRERDTARQRAVRHRSDLPISPALSVISTASPGANPSTLPARQPTHPIHRRLGPLVPLDPLSFPDNLDPRPPYDSSARPPAI